MRRMAHAIDADDADRRLCSWIHQLTLAQQAARDVGNVDAQENLVPLAIDGKVIRDTIAPGRREGSEIKLFSALLHSEAIVIAQRAIPSVTNEITQVQELLAGTDLTGMVVTADAAHAQHATARYLTSTRDSDYVLTVKGNQPGLLEQVHAVPPPPVPGSEHFVDDDFSKGRIVRRAIWAASATSVVFPGVEQVFRIRRDTFDHRGNWLTKEFVHGVTSLTAARCSARQIAEHVRGHWGIENRIHWVRDVVFSEDGQHAYSGSGAHCLAIFRNMAVGLLRLSGRVEIKRAVEWVAADRARIFQVMAGVAHV
jgi:predicted transposase YbfD/YdcC